MNNTLQILIAAFFALSCLGWYVSGNRAAKEGNLAEVVWSIWGFMLVMIGGGVILALLT